jgi:hypothetical protein
MNIQEFFQVCEDFFDQLNPNIVGDYEVEYVEKTSEELLEGGEDEEEDEDDEMGFYNLCCLMIDTLLLINPKKTS